MEFKAIHPKRSFTVLNGFSDDAGNPDPNFPTMDWSNKFVSNGSSTTVHIEIKFANEADLNKIMEMGFQPGFTAALCNLDEVLLH
jgi:hypothetical protein